MDLKLFAVSNENGDTTRSTVVVYQNSTTEPTQKTSGYERGSYIYFDVTLGESSQGQFFVLAYDQLETVSPNSICQQVRK